MAKQRIRFDNEVTSTIKLLCEYHEVTVEELFIKLIEDEYNREFDGIKRKGLA